MINIRNISLATLFGLASSVCIATPYNHVDHNDPGRVIATNVVDTLNCGSLSLSACITPVNIAIWGDEACRDKVLDKSDGFYIGPFDAYYHTISSHGERIVSVIDNNAGSGAFAYTVNIQHSCAGFEHIPPRTVWEG